MEHVDTTRASWIARQTEAVLQDLREAYVGLSEQKGFALVVVVALALGIGANAAVFSVLNGVVLNPLPYEHARDLVRLHAEMPRANVPDANFSVPEIKDVRSQTGSIASLSELHVMYFILLGRSEPERVSTGVVSANFFRTLGVKPILGRG